MQSILPSMRKCWFRFNYQYFFVGWSYVTTIFGTYTATKHALEGYSQALHYEVLPFGVDGNGRNQEFWNRTLASGHQKEMQLDSILTVLLPKSLNIQLIV